jgi:hypothetical protein
MGFFQSLFNKEKGGVKKEVVTPKNCMINTQSTPPPIPTTQKSTAIIVEKDPPPSFNVIVSRTSSHHSSHNMSPNNINNNSPPISPNIQTSSSISSSKTPISLSPPVSQRQSTDLTRPIRFQLCEDNINHIHHLTLPAPNRITQSLNGLVTGIANKSLRLTQWTERKVTFEEILKERAALNVRLHREDTKQTLAEKWGTCQETIGKGTSGVVRVAHKMEGTGERLYAVKVIIINCLITITLLKKNNSRIYN